MIRTMPTQQEDKSWLVERALRHPHLIIREMNNRSFFEFFKYFWPVVSNDELSLNWHIEFLCAELQMAAENLGEGNPKLYDILINIPPGTTKTTIVSIMFPAWCWTRWYWMKFITCSYSSNLSLESAETCRDLIRSSEFRAIYPEIAIKDDKDTKSNFRIVKLLGKDGNNKMREAIGGNRFSTSVGGTVTGFHAHIIIWDDPLNPQMATSSTILNTTNRWIDQVISTRKVDKEISFTIGIMQRINQNDPTGHILKKEKTNLKHICLPGELHTYVEQLKPPYLARYYKNGLLDPKRLSTAVLSELMADLGQYGYAGQVGQTPTPPGGGMFKIDNISILDRLPHPDEFEKVVRYWDKAGTTNGGCFTAGVKMGKTRAGNFIIMDVVRGQWAAEVREAMIKKTAIADGHDVDVWIEQEPGSGGKESAESTIRNLAGFRCFKELPTGDKVYRADPYSVQVNIGNVQMLYGKWNKDYLEELEYFPFSTYKDQVDGSSGAFHKLAGKRKAKAA